MLSRDPATRYKASQMAVLRADYDYGVCLTTPPYVPTLAVPCLLGGFVTAMLNRRRLGGWLGVIGTSFIAIEMLRVRRCGQTYHAEQQEIIDCMRYDDPDQKPRPLDPSVL